MSALALSNQESALALGQVLSCILSALLVIGLVGGFIVVRWAWAWQGIRRLTNRPDLRGTWAGALQSEWINPATGRKLGPIEAYILIHQDLYSLHVRQITAESNSITKTAKLIFEPDGAAVITGTYENDPKNALRERSTRHQGGLHLRVSGASSAKMLKGHYWTDRGTKGEMEFWWVDRTIEEDFGGARRMAKRAGIDAVERMILAKVDEVLADKALPHKEQYLTGDEIHELVNVVIELHLTRDVLVESLDPGLRASLPVHKAPKEQILSDLLILNRCKPLKDGEVPIKKWLETAKSLSTPRIEGEIFGRLYDKLRKKPG